MSDTWEDVLRGWREADPTALLPRALLATALTGFEFDADRAPARAPANAAAYGGLYLALAVCAGALASFRHPAAVAGHLLLAASALLTNDTLAAAASRGIVRAARAVHPPTARRLHAASGGAAGLAGPPHGRARLRVAGAPRGWVQVGVAGVGGLLILRAGAAAARRACLAALFCAALAAAHACFKRPDPKAAVLAGRRASTAGVGPAAAVWRPTPGGAVSPRGSVAPPPPPPVQPAATPVLHPSLVPPPAARGGGAARRDYTL